MKRTIAIVCGGDSSEHDVSMRSGAGLYSFFDKDKYDIYLVETRGMDWQVHLNDGTKTPIIYKDFSFVENGTNRKFDYAYITIHGAPGENGILQGYFEMVKVPYSTSSVLVEALTFDKFALNQYLRSFERALPTACSFARARKVLLIRKRLSSVLACLCL